MKCKDYSSMSVLCLVKEVLEFLSLFLEEVLVNEMDKLTLVSCSQLP